MVPAADEADAAASVVAVSVVRTGGVAGLRRHWQVVPDDAETERWIALIDRCPWESAPRHPAPGVDRFVWAIEARCGDDRRAATLGDAEATGPWRELIDEVRAPRADPPEPV